MTFYSRISNNIRMFRGYFTEFISELWEKTVPSKISEILLWLETSKNDYPREEW